MKVIKDAIAERAIDDKAIIENYPYPVRERCINCKSVLDIDRADIIVDDLFMPSVQCPVCGGQVLVWFRQKVKVNQPVTDRAYIDFSLSNWRWWIMFFGIRILALVGLFLIGYYISHNI